MKPTADTAGEDLCAAVAPNFAELAAAPAWLLAVSGGPDSMALLHLAARWAGERDRAPALHVATVDHGLRPDARREAEAVAAAAAAIGLPHATLPWTGPKPTSRIQEKAREARYGLLATHALTIGATHILTAHHADDQAETVLLRLARGSGVGGLAGMRPLSPLAPDLWLARPLLDVAKADLVAFCREVGIAFVDDPTNRDPAYARTRLRREAAALARLGLGAQTLARFGRRMARADSALEAETDRVEAALRPERAADDYAIALKAAGDIESEIAIRLLRRAVAHVSGETQVRLERLESLADALQGALRHGVAHRATLAGTLVRLDRDGRLVVSREPPRCRGRARSQAPERRD